MTIADEIAHAFAEWEEPLRGWRVYTTPVSLDLPQIPIGAYLPKYQPAVDDGRQETLLSGLVRRFKGDAEPLTPSMSDGEGTSESDEYLTPDVFAPPDENYITYQLALPEDYRGSLRAVSYTHLTLPTTPYV